MSHSHQAESSTPASTNVLLRFLINNRGSILGILGIILAIYFYAVSRTSRDLVYFVHPVKTAVVQANQTSKISVQLEGEPVTEEVSAAQIAIWNNGKESIREENLLTSGLLFVETGEDNPIIEAKVLKVTRDKVVNLILDQSKIGVGQLGVKWAILEQHDGAILQLIYLGDNETQITASATVEQQGEIRALEYGGTIRTPGEQYRRRGKTAKLAGYLYGVLSLIAGAFGASLLREPDLIKRWARNRPRLGATMLLTQAALTAILAFYMIFWLGANPGPPFGF